MKITILAVRDQLRGRIYEVKVDATTVAMLFTFHALDRINTWRLTERRVLQTLLFPGEVLRGHRDRYIAHRRFGSHLVRAVYEHEGDLPVLITVYYPFARRYFQGGRIHEDQILP
jgi:hypothetical protein